MRITASPASVEKFGFSGVITPENPNISASAVATVERRLPKVMISVP
jgi:hypothetical protein